MKLKKNTELWFFFSFSICVLLNFYAQCEDETQKNKKRRKNLNIEYLSLATNLQAIELHWNQTTATHQLFRKLQTTFKQTVTLQLTTWSTKLRKNVLVSKKIKQKQTTTNSSSSSSNHSVKFSTSLFLYVTTFQHQLFNKRYEKFQYQRIVFRYVPFFLRKEQQYNLILIVIIVVSLFATTSRLFEEQTL